MSQSSPTFFIAHCADCAREVLGHRLVQDGALRWACIQCDAQLEEERGRWVDSDAFEALGYFLAPEAAPKHGDSGCRDGKCGVRHPE